MWAGLRRSRQVRLEIAAPKESLVGPRLDDLLAGVVMESDWDVLRVGRAVTATCLLLWATWGAGYTVYVYLLPRHAGASPGSGRTEPGQVRKEGSEPGR